MAEQVNLGAAAEFQSSMSLSTAVLTSMSVYQLIAIVLLVVMAYKYKIPVPCYGCDDLNSTFFRCMSGTGKGSLGCEVVRVGEEVLADLEARYGAAVGFTKRVIAFMLKDVPAAIVNKILEIRDELLQVRDRVVQRLLDFKDYMAGRLSWLGDIIASGVAHTWEAIRDTIVQPLINGFVTYIIDPIVRVITTILELKTVIIQRLTEGFNTLTSLNLNFVSDAFNVAWEQTTHIFNKLDTVVAGGINIVKDGMVGSAQAAVAGMATATEATVSGIVTGVQEATNGIVVGLNKSGAVVEDAVSAITRGTEKTVKAVLSGASEAIDKMLTGLNGTLIPGLETVLDGVLRGLDTTINTGLIDNVVQKPINGTLDILRKVTGFGLDIALPWNIPSISVRPLESLRSAIPANITLNHVPLCDGGSSVCRPVPRIPKPDLAKVDVNLCSAQPNGKCVQVPTVPPVQLPAVKIPPPVIPAVPDVNVRPFQELGTALERINPLNPISDKMRAIKADLTDQLVYIMRPINELIATVLAFKDTIVASVAEFMRAYLSPERLLHFLRAAGDIAAANWAQFRDLVTQYIIDPLLKVFGFVKDTLVTAIDWVKEQVLNVFNTVVTEVHDRFGHLVSMVSEIVSMAAQGVFAGIYFAVGTVIDRATWFIDVNITYKVLGGLLLVLALLAPHILLLGGLGVVFVLKIGVIIVGTILRSLIEMTDYVLPSLPASFSILS